MIDDPVDEKIPVPKFVQKHLFPKNLLPHENIDFFLDEIVVDPSEDHGIWGKNKNMTAIRKRVTIDMFFPKQEPVSPEINKISDPCSSESEYEMVHKVKHTYSSNKKIKKEHVSPLKESAEVQDNSLNQLVNSPNIKKRKSDELPLYHEKLPGNIPLVEEESGICASENDSSNERMSASNHENNSSDSDESLITDVRKLNKSNNSSEQNNELGETAEKTNKLEHCSSSNSPHKNISIKQVSDADLVSDSSEKSSISLFEESQTKKILDRSKKLPEAHALSDDEIIPLSQDLKPCLRLSLGSADKLDIRNVSVKSVINSTNTPKELKQSKLKLSFSEKLKSGTQSESVHENSMLEQIKNKMTEIRKLPQENGINVLLNEDITEEDEIYLIQCPKDVDGASFIGKEFSLEGSSSISLEKRGKAVNFDSFTIKEDSERCVNIVLPSKNCQDVMLGVFTLAGNIILTEATEEPVLKMPEVEPPRKVQFPEGLEELCSSISVSDVSMNDSMNSVHKKKKKKKKEHLEDIHKIEEVNDASFSDSLKKKRKHEDSFFSSESCNDSSKERSPKKKRKREESLLSSESCIDTSTERPSKKRRKYEELSDTFNSSTAGVVISSLLKKKKKKSRDIENSIDGAGIAQLSGMEDLEPDATVSSEGQIDNSIVKKKKKKKRHTIGVIEYLTNEVIPDPLRDMKTELVENELTASSEILSDDSIIKKKKKKRYAIGGENEVLFVQPVLPESSFSEKHKKKHKKKSLD